MLEMTRDQKTKMHEISHGKRDSFSLSGKDPGVVHRLLRRNQYHGLSLSGKYLGVVRRLIERNKSWYRLSWSVKDPDIVCKFLGCNQFPKLY